MKNNILPYLMILTAGLFYPLSLLSQDEISIPTVILVDRTLPIGANGFIHFTDGGEPIKWNYSVGQIHFTTPSNWTQIPDTVPIILEIMVPVYVGGDPTAISATRKFFQRTSLRKIMCANFLHSNIINIVFTDRKKNEYFVEILSCGEVPALREKKSRKAAYSALYFGDTRRHIMKTTGTWIPPHKNQ